MCGTNWCDFLDNKIAAILPCNHACCLKCLVKHFKAHNEDESLKKQNPHLRCPLCNLSLSKNIFHKLAQAFVSKNLIDSFKIYNEILEFSPQRFDMLLVDFLIKNDFNLNKVENHLWNMASLLVNQNQEENLSSQAKQKIYEEARAPVLALRAEINKLKMHLKSTKDKNLCQSLENELNEMKRREFEAKINASNDLFEQMNANRMLVKTKNDLEIFSVDFHGLHVYEALAKVNELILPILDVVRQIEIVCGKGINSRSGVGVLKVALQDYFRKMNIMCTDLVYNSGAFIVHI